LAIEALQGLAAIHRAGIVHRDISPENIMIHRDEDGEQHVKLIDLGIAKQGDATDASKTKTGMFVGKWKYCSPEHLGILDAGERIDGRADLYSFGIVLYEMLAGVPPFQADTPHRYLMLHASETPRPMREVNPTVPAAPELEAIMFRALEKDRAKRFATARDFADAIEKIAAALPDTPGTQPLPLATEVTDEATRAARDVATVFTRELAPTVITDSSKVERPRPRGRAAAVIAALVVILIAAGAATMLREQQKVPASTPVHSAAVAATVVPRASGHLGINAFPWAEV